MSQEKPVTVAELRTFIEAVEFASDKDDWVPSERQWKRIRSMIDRLVEPPAAAAQPAPAAPTGTTLMALPPYRGESPLAPVVHGPAPIPTMPSSFQQYPPAPPPSGPFAGGAVPVKTPDIDTSQGKPYESSFA